MRLTLQYDLRSGPGGAPHEALYAAVLDHAAWLDALAIDDVGITLNEHHGAEDGYLPAPLLLAAALAGRTARVRISVVAVIAPFIHPVRLAEDLAVLDLVSGGRVSVVLAAGYRAEEFAMFGQELARRGEIMEETVAVLEHAWTGEPFEFRGETIRVTPRPAQRPRPPIVLGGSSPAAARRAARIADGFVPSAPELADIYEAERVRLGGVPRAPGPAPVPAGQVVMVTDDPDAGWAIAGDHCVHTMNSYARWIEAGSGASGPFRVVADAAELRATGRYLVLTPAECVELARRAGGLMVSPLIGGLAPDVAAQTLERIAAEVVPSLS